MPIKLEDFLLDYLLCPPAQDEFTGWKLQLLLLKYSHKIHVHQLEDVKQILHKCIIELERMKEWKEGKV